LRDVGTTGVAFNRKVVLKAHFFFKRAFDLPGAHIPFLPAAGVSGIMEMLGCPTAGTDPDSSCFTLRIGTLAVKIRTGRHPVPGTGG
jgi:hypothetical protein